MSVDIVQKYGPGLSFYLVRVKPSAQKDMPTKWSSSSLRVCLVLYSYICQKFSATLKELHASNERLEAKASELCCNTIQLELDVMKLRRHVKALHGELLVTWQVDTLTRLVEVVYERHGWKLPCGVTATSHRDMDQATLSLMYRTAARKIKRETLKRRFGLSVKYYLASAIDHSLSKHKSIPIRVHICSIFDITEREKQAIGSGKVLGTIVSIVLWSDCAGNI